MAQSSDKRGFRLTWRIENFSMCPAMMRDSISSPTFVVDELNKTEWCLKLYPKGCRIGDGVACFLKRTIGGQRKPEELNVFYDIKLVRLHSKSYTIIPRKHPAERLSGHGYNSLITFKNLLEIKDTILPNDVLTILCYMFGGTEHFENSSEKFDISASLDNNTYSLNEISTFISDFEISTFISDFEISTEQRHDACIITTRIPVERSVISWTIKDFKTQTEDERKIPVLVVTKMRKKLALLLHCYLSGSWDRDGRVKIDIQRKDKHFNLMLIKCEVSILDNKGTAQKCFEGQHMFGEKYEIWSFPLSLKTGTIQNRESELLNDGALTLQCEFLVSFKGDEVTINNCDLQVYKHGIVSDDLLTDMRNMVNDEKLTDVTLISEGLELPVHKFVICARSPVFTAMFTNDTEEKRTGIVRINDIDADTLINMKNFMYGNDLPDLQPEEAMKLYSAADKYGIFTLKDWCVDSLKYTLSILNVCEVLVLADLHDDGDLLSYVQDFLEKHASNVLQSDEWTLLMESNTKLAARIMRTLLLTLASSLSL